MLLFTIVFYDGTDEKMTKCYFEMASSVSFGTKEQFIPLIRDLCDDDGLKVFVGEGVRDLEFEYVN